MYTLIKKSLNYSNINYTYKSCILSSWVHEKISCLGLLEIRGNYRKNIRDTTMRILNLLSLKLL